MRCRIKECLRIDFRDKTKRGFEVYYGVVVQWTNDREHIAYKTKHRGIKRLIPIAATDPYLLILFPKPLLKLLENLGRNLITRIPLYLPQHTHLLVMLQQRVGLFFELL